MKSISIYYFLFICFNSCQHVSIEADLFIDLYFLFIDRGRFENKTCKSIECTSSSVLVCHTCHSHTCFPIWLIWYFGIDGDGRVCIHLSSIICCTSKRLCWYAHGTGELLKVVHIIGSYFYICSCRSMNICVHCVTVF